MDCKEDLIPVLRKSDVIWHSKTFRQVSLVRGCDLNLSSRYLRSIQLQVQFGFWKKTHRHKSTDCGTFTWFDGSLQVWFPEQQKGIENISSLMHYTRTLFESPACFRGISLVSHLRMTPKEVFWTMFSHVTIQKHRDVSRLGLMTGPLDPWKAPMGHQILGIPREFCAFSRWILWQYKKQVACKPWTKVTKF